jgi:glutathione peroxidase
METTMKRRTLLLLTASLALAALLPRQPRALAPFVFREIGGDTIDLAAFRGRPVLVVNTASRCGFTRQYDALQALYDRYRDRGLVVLGVPSNSFRQELSSAAAVRDFCEVNFGIDFPMTDIVEVRGPGAHPFFAWAGEQGAAPRWNFHKILLDGEGRIAASFPAQVPPDAPAIIAAVERLLPGA